MLGHLADVITYAKFQVEIFRGYDFTGGRISHFPIDFCMGLTTVQRDCTACEQNVGVRRSVFFTTVIIYTLEMGRSSVNAEVRPNNSAECSVRFGNM